jgi:hypothetical protein
MYAYFFFTFWKFRYPVPKSGGFDLSCTPSFFAGIPHIKYLCTCCWLGLPTVNWNSHGYESYSFVRGPVLIFIYSRIYFQKKLLHKKKKIHCCGLQFTFWRRSIPFIIPVNLKWMTSQSVLSYFGLIVFYLACICVLSSIKLQAMYAHLDLLAYKLHGSNMFEHRHLYHLVALYYI